MDELAGKVAVVTGGSRGMGREMVLAFAERGARVVVASRRLESCRAVADEAERRFGGEALPVAVNVSDWDDCDRLVETVYDRFGRVDVLVNNAGLSPLYPSLPEVSQELFDKVVAVNLRGPFLCCRAVLPHMIERRSGKIVNIAGTSSLRGYKNRVSYSASKWAVRGLTRTIALEVGVYGINVNSVAPGPIYGERMEKIIVEKARVRGTTPEAVFEEYLSEQALKRFTSAVDVAYAVLFLASEESRQITGQVITVDGGWDV